MLSAGSHRNLSTLAAASLAALLAVGAPASAQELPAGKEFPQTFTATLKDVKVVAPEKPGRPLPSARLGFELDSALVPQVALDMIDRAALLAQDAENRLSGKTKVLRYGVGRPVSLRAEDGSWHEVQGGYLWVAEIASPEAMGLRLHFQDARLPEGAELAVYGTPEAVAAFRPGFKSADGTPAVAPKVERRFGSADAKAQSFWTPTLEGERVRIELFLPGGVRELPFNVDRLQHIYVDPVHESSRILASKLAGPCHNDVTCYPEWEAVARAVAGYGVVGDDSVFCTGQLLNSQRTDFTPYFLTANHCLDSGGEAASAEFYWFYQTAGCGEAAPRLSNSPSSVGATLLTTNPASDFTLLMINGALPEGVTWAGWNSAPVRNGVAATAIHHPDGDYKRISFGDKTDSAVCGSRDLIRISWTDAVTEPGSSGSGIFRNDTKQLFGQLFFGPSSCGNQTYDCYGAFSSTFPKIRNLLREGSDDRQEQNDTCRRPRVMRVGATSNIVKITDQDWYRINVPPGRTLRVRLEFSNNNGDVDLRLFGNCAAEPLAVSDGIEDAEELTFTNTGARAATYTWQVFLANDTRNDYTMRVSIE